MAESAPRKKKAGNRLTKWLGRVGGERDAQQMQIGFLPTLDAAVLLTAQQRGYFAEQRLDVRLVRDTSWHHLRDRLIKGELTAAHLPGTVPLTTSLGIDCAPHALRTAFVLSLNGSSFAVSGNLRQQLGASGTVAEFSTRMGALVEARKRNGEARLRFAVTGQHSVGSYDLRYWLAAGGCDPAHDVELVAITPARVLASLRAGRYDGAWLDEPYVGAAAAEGLLTPLYAKHAFWNNSLAKVLAVNAAWADGHIRTHKRLLRALLLAAQWLDENRPNAVEFLASAGMLNADPDLVAAALGQGDKASQRLGVNRYAAGFPWYSQAVWYLGQMIRWGDYADVLDFKRAAQAVFSPREYRDAARDLAIPYPTIGYKNEGLHSEAWMLEEASHPIAMDADQFFDERVFQARQTMKYLNGLKISHVRAPLEAMWAIR